MRNSSLARFLLVSLLVVCLTLVFLAPSNAQDTGTDKPTPAPGEVSAPPTSPPPTPPAKPAPPVPASPAVSPVTQAAVKAGVLVCASRINQVVTFLAGNSESTAYLFTPQRQPDQSLFSVSLMIEGQNATLAYASASFAPTTSGQAAAVYDTVQYLPQSCAEVEKGIFKNLKRKGNLGKDTIILDGGAVTIFLMPAGSGCIVIKKEVVQ